MKDTYNDKIWKHKHLAKPGLSVERAVRTIKEDEGLNKQESEDTTLRKELQELIKSLAEEGNSVEEIVDILSAFEKYSKFKVFFHGYAENQIKKIKNNPNVREER